MKISTELQSFQILGDNYNKFKLGFEQSNGCTQMIDGVSKF